MNETTHIIEKEGIEASAEWKELENNEKLKELIAFKENCIEFIKYSFEEENDTYIFNDEKIKALKTASEELYSEVNSVKMVFYLSKLVFKDRPGKKDSWKKVVDYYGGKIKLENDNDNTLKLDKLKKEIKKSGRDEVKGSFELEGKNYEVSFGDLMDALIALSEIYNSIALNSVKWFNERIKEALNEKEDDIFKIEASAYSNGVLIPYFWYQIKFYSEANPISLSVFANINQNKKIAVAIELHDSKAKKNRIPSYFREKINSIISILDDPDKYELDKTKIIDGLKYIIIGGENNKGDDDEYTRGTDDSINDVPKDKKSKDGKTFYNSLENEINDKGQRIRVFYEIDKLADSTNSNDNNSNSEENNSSNKDNSPSNDTTDTKDTELSNDIKRLSPLAKIVSKTTYIEQEIYKTIYSRNVNQMILTGAPGTGKTYGAKMYVKSMVEDNEKRMSFVQFHPSYDYTDFVEGIRPIKIDDKTSYVKMDGTFKDFCRKIVDGSLEKLRPDNLKELLPSEYVPDDSSSSGAENDGSTEDESAFDFPSYEKVISCPDDSEVKNEAEKAAAEKRRIFDFIKKIAFKKEKDRSDFELELLKIFDSTNEYEELYYFIIDEVNRADISKVLGELMYGLEYRGLENRFPTQYQQLEEVYKKEKDEYKPLLFDCFLDGFFIPKNLVIIGTMNDIDKSVESFDFALRRRFHWITVGVDEDTIRDVLKGISVKKGYDNEKDLDKLVSAIHKMNGTLVEEGTRFGLSSEYKIGPTYFSSLINGNAVKKEDVEGVFDLKVRPTLREYVRGSKKEALVKDFIDKCNTALKEVFKNSHDSEKSERE